MRGRTTWRRTPIVTQLVMFTLVLAVPIIGAGAYAVRQGRSNATDAARRSSEQMTALVASNLEQFVSEARTKMERIVERELIRAVDGNRCDPFLAEVLALEPNLANIAVVDAEGQGICSVVAAPPGPLPSLAGSDNFEAAKRAGQFYVAEPDIGVVTKRRVVTFVMPIKAGGQTVGYLFFPVDRVRFQTVLEGLAGVSQALVSVVTDRGQIVARSSESDRYVGQILDHQQMALLNHPSGIAAGVDGVKRIYATSRVEGTNWVVSAGVPVSVAYGSSDRLGTRLLVVSLALLIIAVVAAIIIGRRITRPVRALAGRAEELASGEPYVDLPLDGPRELAVAAGWFNEMVASQTTASEERRRLWEQLAEARHEAADRRIALLERLAVAEDTERDRIAAVVHDETIQELAAASLHVEGLARGLSADRIASEEVEDRLAEITVAMHSATESVRRVVFDLAPADVSGGLLAAIRAAGSRFFADTDTSVVLDGDELHLDATRMQLVYRIVVEALSNTRRHAQAHEVHVKLKREGTQVVVSVTDDGLGVPPSGPVSRPGHLGVRLMAERAEILGGTCLVARRDEGGTAVTLQFELVASDPARTGLQDRPTT